MGEGSLERHESKRALEEGRRGSCEMESSFMGSKKANSHNSGKNGLKTIVVV